LASSVAADVAAIGYLGLRNLSSSVAGVAVDGVVMSFVEFALSREGQDIIAAQGLIPVR
jgi:ABC-type phosphate transport system substrate-binding protein